jgi:hypothetical protein
MINSRLISEPTLMGAAFYTAQKISHPAARSLTSDVR